MSIDRSLPFTARKILEELEIAAMPLTKSELAGRMGVVYQTINNHFPMLIQRGLIKEVGKIGNAMKYELGEESDSLPRIQWKGQSIQIVQLLRAAVADGHLPKERFSNDIVWAFAKMYEWAANAVDDDNPKSIRLDQMKEIQTTFARYRQMIQWLDQTLKSALENDNLWDPKEWPRMTMFKDPEMSPEVARSIFEQIKKMREEFNKKES